MFKRVVALALNDGAGVVGWIGGLPRRPAQPAARTGHAAPADPPRAAPPAPAPAPAPTLLFDEGSSWAPGGIPVTITVYARGRLDAPVRLRVSSDRGGKLSKTLLVLPAGLHSSDSFCFTPGCEGVSTLRYGTDEGRQVPAPRRVYALADPVGHAAQDLAAAAHALLARHGASKWEMADGCIDAVHGRAAADGQRLRAIADSGFGASSGHAMDMLNWLDAQAAPGGAMVPPIMRTVGGKRCSDHTAEHTWGFWCKRAPGEAGTPPQPRGRVPYHLHDPHFALIALSVPGLHHGGVAFQASKAEENHALEIRLLANQPQARWVDDDGQQVVLTAQERLAPHAPAVIAITSRPGRQSLRVNGVEAGRADATFAPSSLAQLLIGWGFRNYFPNPGFGGHVYAVATGRGVPSDAELAVLERYLAGTCGASMQHPPAG